MDLNLSDLKVIAGPGCAPSLRANLVKGISRKAYQPFDLTSWTLHRFSDGEVLPQIGENIRGKDVYIVGSTYPLAETYNIFRLLLRAAAKASAGSITAVLPYMGGLRQDRKDRPRVPITAQQYAQEIVLAMEGVSARHVMIMQPHNSSIDLAFTIPVDLLYPTDIFINHFKATPDIDLSRVRAGSPDVGGVKMADVYARRLNIDYVIGDKWRDPETEETEIRKVIGDPADSIILSLDDIIDTGGSTMKFCFKLHELGALAVYAYAPHGLLVGPAMERLAEAVEKADLKKVVITDTIDNSNRQLPDFVEVVSVGRRIGEAIFNNHAGLSISEISGMFQDPNGG